jgi:L-ascorbate metabolism protein UlaG (beta-lactamase superfamily)
MTASPAERTLRIRSYAHAAFRLEGDGLSVVTDPYEPKIAGFAPIDEPADLVLMSSHLDRFHSDPSHVGGNPQVVNVLKLPAAGATVCGVEVQPFRSRERFQWQMLLALTPPRPYAMYRFTLGGLSVLHTGDLSRRIPPAQADLLRGRVDVLLAIAGAVHNIEHDELLATIEDLAPRIVIPMHYWLPHGVLKNLPVERFLALFRPEQVVREGVSEVVLSAASLPAERRIVVLEPSR